LIQGERAYTLPSRKILSTVTLLDGGDNGDKVAGPSGLEELAIKKKRCHF